MFEIEKDVPIPKKSRTRQIYNFAGMEVGECFSAPRDMGLRGNTDKRQHAILNCAIAYARDYCPTAKFTTRIIDENTVRCWRVA